MSDASRHLCRHVRDIKGYVPGEQPRTPGLIKLNTNENPYPPSPRVLEVLARVVEGDLRLYPDPVSLDLRTCIAALHGCRVEQVFAGNGSDEVLALCTRAFVEDEGEIGCFDPSYSLYPVLAAIRPARLRAVALQDDYTWSNPGCRKASLFYLANPNAPTSMAFPKEKIRDFCETFSGVVLIDEAYADFAPENCMDLALACPNVLVSRSLSKSYSLAGIRAGYVVGSEALVSALFRIKDSYNVNALTQKMALAALEDQDHMWANCARIVSTRERVSLVLSRRGCHVFPSATNFLWVRPPSGHEALEVVHALRERNILVRYFPGAKTGSCLRVTIGTDEQMNALIDAWPS